jgi:GT2 family glycosyltransferase
VEDVDLARRRAAAGWRLRYEPAAEVHHEVGASTRRRPWRSRLAHARSLDRYVAGLLRPLPRRVLRLPLRAAIGAWAVVSWSVERLSVDRASTGERTRAATAR